MLIFGGVPLSWSHSLDSHFSSPIGVGVGLEDLFAMDDLSFLYGLNTKGRLGHAGYKSPNLTGSGLGFTSTEIA